MSISSNIPCYIQTACCKRLQKSPPQTFCLHLTSPILFALCCAQGRKSTCGFRKIRCFTGKGYCPFAQPPTWRARCCNSSDLSPGTCPARLNLLGTVVPADIASRVIKASKPPHHDKVQHFQTFCLK